MVFIFFPFFFCNSDGDDNDNGDDDYDEESFSLIRTVIEIQTETFAISLWYFEHTLFLSCTALNTK